MSDTITCPSCQRTLRVPESLLGQLVKCPTCQQTFTAALGGDANGAPEPPPKKEAPPPPPRPRERYEDEPPRPVRREEDDYHDRPRRRRRRYQQDHGQLPPELLERFADALAATNGLFKRQRFLDAATPSEGRRCAAA